MSHSAPAGNLIDRPPSFSIVVNQDRLNAAGGQSHAAPSLDNANRSDTARTNTVCVTWAITEFMLREFSDLSQKPRVGTQKDRVKGGNGIDRTNRKGPTQKGWPRYDPAAKGPPSRIITNENIQGNAPAHAAIQAWQADNISNLSFFSRTERFKPSMFIDFSIA